MGDYTDPKYNVRYFVPQAFGVNLGTSTGASVSLTDAFPSFSRFKRRTMVSAVRLRCSAPPATGVTSLVASFLNGTNTFGTAVLSGATQNQTLDAVITNTANADFAANGKPTANVTGTATGSGLSLGTFDVWFEVSEQYE